MGVRRAAPGLRGPRRAGRKVDAHWIQVFRRSLAFGKAHIADIAREEAPLRGISETVARQYLERNVVFELGAAEYDGRKLFLRLAASLLSSNPEEILAR